MISRSVAINKVRLNLLLAMTLLFTLFLGIRLFSQQVIRHSYYSNLAKGQHVVKRSIDAKRGEIFVEDPDGTLFPLALNQKLWEVLVVPNQVFNPGQVVKKLGSFFKLSKKDKKQLLTQIIAKPSYIPPLQNSKGKTIRVTLEQKIALEKSNLDGVLFIERSNRLYPEGKLGSQILGFVDYENNGNYGIEGYYNDMLKGQSGSLSRERDPNGRIITTGNNVYQQEVDGSSVVLTIDRTIQDKVEQILEEAVTQHKADSGSIVVMDPFTGDIVGLANYPTFDSNQYQKVKNYDILNNASVAKAYEPGSVFKPIAMAAALDAGKIKSDSESVFGSSIVIDKRTIKTSTGQAYGRENMTQVLENSDNVAMVWVGQQMGKKIYYDYLSKFGFGIKTGIDLASESSGKLKPVDKWLDVEAATITFGQGISVTPLQLAMAYSVLANGGKLIKPRMVKTLIYSDGTVEELKPKVIRQVISEDTANAISAMLISVVERGHGKQAGVKGYWVGGKTGTAQIPTPYGYDYRKTIGTFGGFFPANNPKYVMIVKIDVPKDVIWAESSAAPAFGKLASWLLTYSSIPPSRKEQLITP